jgi:hypothetical protein
MNVTIGNSRARTNGARRNDLVIRDGSRGGSSYLSACPFVKKEDIQSKNRLLSILALKVYVTNDLCRLLPLVRLGDEGLTSAEFQCNLDKDVPPNHETSIPVLAMMIAARPAHSPY